MKKSILVFLIFILSINSVFAQYKRKLKEPDFFIPYNDRMHQPEQLSKFDKKKKVLAKTMDKTQENKETNKKINNKNKEDKNKSLFKIKPDYKKIYDNYLKEINVFITSKEFSNNIAFENDLKAMSTGEIFEVFDDNSSNIDTQEQYDFYMLAKDILKN